MIGPFYKGAVLSALAPLEFSISISGRLLYEITHYSGAKTLYFGNSRISNRQKSIYLFSPSYTKAFASLLIL